METRVLKDVRNKTSASRVVKFPDIDVGGANSDQTIKVTVSTLINGMAIIRTRCDALPQ